VFVIETNNLTHRFSSKEIVLDSIDLKVPEKSIYGFLGPNGAGKTTTLKLLLGLLKKQEGSIAIFGKPFETNRIEILKKIGSLIEVPSLYGQLTAEENLLVLQKIYRCDKDRILEVLKMVDLDKTGKKKAGQFSLGMKQRLSIAASLLHKPDMLILDEPTNGLDPNGIIEIRELLKRINKEQGISIIVSSHLLSEIEKLVTHLGIINKGKLIFQGTLQELSDKQQNSTHIVFETDNIDKTLEIMKASGLSYVLKDGKLFVKLLNKEKTADLNRQLVNNQVNVYGINSVTNDLESIFIDLTKPL
jgi:lantibiotic transport system ATP-binding protein